MTIPDEAVQAMPERIYAMPKSDTKHCVVAFDEASLDYHIEYVRADLAAPFLQGAKVKALEWVEIPACNGLNTAKTQFGTYTIGSSLVVRYGLKSISKPLATLEVAKAAAQADYEARIRSAIETRITVSVPSTAKLEAARKAVEELANTHMCLTLEDWSRISSTILSAIEVAPSPRSQVLEEAELAVGSTVLKHKPSDYEGLDSLEAYEAGQLNGLERAQASLRALSSRPVANGWFPIESAPKDGTVIQVWHQVHKCPVSVLWKDDGFPYRGERLNWYERSYTTAWPESAFTHWRPLPASPEVSGCCRDCDGYNCDDGCAFPVIPSARDLALEEAARLVENKRHIFHSRENTAASIRALSFHDHSLFSGRSK